MAEAAAPLLPVLPVSSDSGAPVLSESPSGRLPTFPRSYTEADANALAWEPGDPSAIRPLPMQRGRRIDATQCIQESLQMLARRSRSQRRRGPSAAVGRELQRPALASLMRDAFWWCFLEDWQRYPHEDRVAELKQGAKAAALTRAAGAVGAGTDYQPREPTSRLFGLAPALPSARASLYARPPQPQPQHLKRDPQRRCWVKEMSVATSPPSSPRLLLRSPRGRPDASVNDPLSCFVTQQTPSGGPAPLQRTGTGHLPGLTMSSPGPSEPAILTDRERLQCQDVLFKRMAEAHHDLLGTPSVGRAQRQQRDVLFAELPDVMSASLHRAFTLALPYVPAADMAEYLNVLLRRVTYWLQGVERLRKDDLLPWERRRVREQAEERRRVEDNQKRRERDEKEDRERAEQFTRAAILKSPSWAKEQHHTERRRRPQPLPRRTSGASAGLTAVRSMRSPSSVPHVRKPSVAPGFAGPRGFVHVDSHSSERTLVPQAPVDSPPRLRLLRKATIRTRSSIVGGSPDQAQINAAQPAVPADGQRALLAQAGALLSGRTAETSADHSGIIRPSGDGVHVQVDMSVPLSIVGAVSVCSIPSQEPVLSAIPTSTLAASAALEELTQGLRSFREEFEELTNPRPRRDKAKPGDTKNDADGAADAGRPQSSGDEAESNDSEQRAKRAQPHSAPVTARGPRPAPPNAPDTGRGRVRRGWLRKQVPDVPDRAGRSRSFRAHARKPGTADSSPGPDAGKRSPRKVGRLTADDTGLGLGFRRARRQSAKHVILLREATRQQIFVRHPEPPWYEAGRRGDAVPNVTALNGGWFAVSGGGPLSVRYMQERGLAAATPPRPVEMRWICD
eukprot:TRINITY_DN13148_c0_g1_i1.p1 TRINITY_DN13148_c0_g1~~TRINITY_DN13148_c0_g1_i1.p1  ORF type:complete len:863 (+),score=173.67 TRINITY_DN13148_c0_g1_i1:48-2591(+)